MYPFVFACTNETSVNQLVFDDAIKSNVWINRADRADLSTFHVPAIVDRGDVQVAIVSGGMSPALSVRIKHEIEAILPQNTADYAKALGQLRHEVHPRILAKLAAKDMQEQLMQGEPDKLVERMREQANQLLRQLKTKQ